jgi:hypothetical protein
LKEANNYMEITEGADELEEWDVMKNLEQKC